MNTYLLISLVISNQLCRNCRSHHSRCSSERPKIFHCQKLYGSDLQALLDQAQCILKTFHYLDPRYPRGLPWDQILCYKNVVKQKYLGLLCSWVYELFKQKNDLQAIKRHSISMQSRNKCKELAVFASKFKILPKNSLT